MICSTQIVSLMALSLCSFATFHTQQVHLPAKYSSLTNSDKDLTVFDNIIKNNSKIDSDLKIILSRKGPDLRTSSNYEDFKDIRVEHAARAWSLMRSETLKMVNRRLDQLWPQLNELLVEEPEISNGCLKAINVTLLAARSLESWAIRMLNAWGNFPPIGLLDGVYSDIGSFHGCLQAYSADPFELLNEKLGQPQYCTVSYRPVVPSRSHFHKIISKEKQFSMLIRNSLHQDSNNLSTAKNDIFYHLVDNAQYFHYVYIKTGICTPSRCRPHDLKILAKHIGDRAKIMTGPIKCYVNLNERSLNDNSILANDIGTAGDEILIVQGQVSYMQKVALIILGAFLILVLVSTVIHAIVMFVCHEKAIYSFENTATSNATNKMIIVEAGNSSASHHRNGTSSWMAYVKDFSLIENTRSFLDVGPTKPNEITCLNGLRSITMLWIVIVHSLQYNDWSGFSRIHQIENSLVDPVSQPLLNANYLVDTFFLISGLLTTYSIWSSNRNQVNNFSWSNHLIGRYLRLTPQVLITGLLFIIMPLSNPGGSPHWYETTHYFSQNCQKNLWINLLHLQSFYKSDEMCNLVSWWISVDMFYHLIGLVLICLLVCKKQLLSLFLGSTIVVLLTFQAINMHINGRFTPNMLATVPQVDEVWTNYVMGYFWSPYPHSFSFFFGLLLGYMMGNNIIERNLVNGLEHLGWPVALVTLATVSFANHWWLDDTWGYTPMVAALFNQLTPILWSLSLGWIIVACHHKWDNIFNRILSCGFFTMLGKVSYIIYLSHMIIVCSFYGSQNLLLEVSQLMLHYIIIGNMFISILFGIALCVCFEMPLMSLHRRTMSYLKNRV